MLGFILILLLENVCNAQMNVLNALVQQSVLCVLRDLFCIIINVYNVNLNLGFTLKKMVIVVKNAEMDII